MRRLLAGLAVLFTLVPAGVASAAGDGPDDRIVIVGPVVVDRDETVSDVIVGDGDVTVRGNVDGDIIAVTGDVTVRGSVSGDIITLDGTTTLGRRARVGGDLLYVNEEPVVTNGARVSGETKRFDGGGLSLGVAAIGFWLAVSLSLLVLGLLLLVVAPRAADAIARTLKARWGRSIGIGIGAFLLLPVVAVLALVTILGIPFGIILLLALAPLYAIGYVAAAFAAGRLIIKGPRIPAFLVGLAILRGLALVPFAGGFVGLLATIFGLGLLLATLIRARS